MTHQHGERPRFIHQECGQPLALHQERCQAEEGRTCCRFRGVNWLCPEPELVCPARDCGETFKRGRHLAMHLAAVHGI